MQAFRHGCEGKPISRSSITEGTFPGVIAGEKQMLILLVPHGKTEGTGEMVNALLLPALPGRQKQGAVRHDSQLRARETQLPPQFVTVIETYIRNQRGRAGG